MFSLILRQMVFVTVIFGLSYGIYLWPVLYYMGLFSVSIPLSYHILLSVFIGLLIIIYFQTTLTFWPLKFFVYFGLGAGFYGVIISGVCWLLSPVLSSEVIAVLMPVSLGLILMYGYLNSRRIIIRTLSFSNKKITEPCRLIFISDVHLGSEPIQRLHRLIQKINELNPQALLIGGDLIDSNGFDLSELSCLKNLKMPIYFVTGNHEFYLKDSSKKMNELMNCGIQRIDQKTVENFGVRLIGIGDNYLKNQPLNWVRNLPKTPLFTILMVHQPLLWPEAADVCDLMLSGHTHAGQLAPFHWLVQLQFKFYMGLYQNHQSWLFVSSGLGNWGPKLRIGSTCELVDIQLIPE
jgi:predicted MPP superfamily phosphohydrolase